MKKCFAMLLALVMTVGLVTGALAYGTITDEGYKVTDSFSAPYDKNRDGWDEHATCSAVHATTGAYRRHYSNATVNKGGRNGKKIQESGRQYTNGKTSSANLFGWNGPDYGPYGWWGWN